jgi:thymidylate synthase
MEFIPLHFADRLKVINPQGTIGVVTLWSKPDYVIERFRQAGVDLNPTTSPIAVFGTLYGNGLREMLRNLLWNPQIQTLLICGNDRSGSAKELQGFFQGNLEPVDSPLINYKNPPGIEKVSILRISFTNRLIDDLVKPEEFKWPPKLEIITDPHKEEVINDIRKFPELFKPVDFFAEYPWELEEYRIEIPLPEVEVQFYPSNPREHQIVRNTPLGAWKELLYLLSRFGRRVTLKKGDRLELQNVKVVVEKPEFDTEKLQQCNLDTEKFRRYQEEILNPEKLLDAGELKGQLTLPHFPRVELRDDETYSYGHRLREYFKDDNLMKFDGLMECVKRLQRDSEDRKAYFTLWDNPKDLNIKKKQGHPCFVSMFFRKYQGKLTLTATFRTHNAMDGWLLNCHGLMAIQKFVAERVKMTIGAITVISHSISLDPRELDRAMLIIGKRRFQVRLDPMGYFRITLDAKEILVEHRFGDVTLKEYRGKKAERLQHEIARDVAVSDINHAIYLGRQLAKAEMALKDGREFVQD